MSGTCLPSSATKPAFVEQRFASPSSAFVLAPSCEWSLSHVSKRVKNQEGMLQSLVPGLDSVVQTFTRKIQFVSTKIRGGGRKKRAKVGIICPNMSASHGLRFIFYVSFVVLSLSNAPCQRLNINV